MNILADSRQMKMCDNNTIHHFGIPSLVLMERAALATAEIVEEKVKPRACVLVVCGTGNNGGDGFAVARILHQKKYRVIPVMTGDWDKVTPETRQQMEICQAYGIEIYREIPVMEYGAVIDALFGIGLSREIRGKYAGNIEQMNELPGLKVAVDIPSGIQADTGNILGTAFRADITVTFAFAKPGLLLYPGAEYAGSVIVKDIGITPESFLNEKITVCELTKQDLQLVPERRDYSNKGSYGKVLVVAGHKNMAGAAFFSGKAAYATGAGLVKLYTEEENRIILQQLLPEAVLETYDSGLNPEAFQSSMDSADVIVAGPGIGTEEKSEEIIKAVLKYAKVPVILDADGLNLLSQHLEWLQETKAPVLVTPHLGEMARLTKKSIFDIQKQLLQLAREFAEEYNVICILKDARTVTALPDGRAYINTSGNNGMAAAGAGDVLTGVLAGLIAQGMDIKQAAPLGVYLHGSGGDWIRRQSGTYGMTAQDIIEGVRQVLREIVFDRKGNQNEDI